MTEDEFKSLKQGDVIESGYAGATYLVLGSSGDRKAVIEVELVDNSGSWTLLNGAEPEMAIAQQARSFMHGHGVYLTLDHVGRPCWEDGDMFKWFDTEEQAIAAWILWWAVGTDRIKTPEHIYAWAEEMRATHR